MKQQGLPTGSVTFFFSDIEGSTRLLHELGPDDYAAVLADHRRVVRAAFTAHGGVEVGTEGDSFFVAFPSPTGAVEAARSISEGLAGGPIRVRIGLHTGAPLLTDEGYVGVEIHRAARIAAAGHGGQVLVSATTAAEAGTAGLRELGEHRLKDFDQPISIYQLGEERFPPLKTISNTNLPRPASSFVGRDSEVAAVTALLQDGARLVTLTGPGGTGKTRLAIEAATGLVTAFKAGIFWVDLAPIRDPLLVTGTIGQVVGAKDGVADHIGDREMLLLVDNLEQVVDAAPDLAALVEACPRLRLLVTSREKLRVRGEVEVPVAPLADPDAVALFCARAGVEADESVHQLCLALDNLPLALELAAARASVLTPAQILERLAGRLDMLKGGRDADPRQQTLRATIEWSYALLSPDDQRLFARLAVFRGGWTLAQAEQVAGAELDGLESLVDKSLVRHAGDRFWMLETIREYAGERLEASAEAGELRRRHADFFLLQAEEAEPGLRVEEYRGGEEASTRQLSELDNYRAALDTLAAEDQPQRYVRLVGALAAIWASPVLANKSLVAEGRVHLERAVALDRTPSPARAKALDAIAELTQFSEDTKAARRWAEEALELHRRLDDSAGIAHALSGLGAARGQDGDWEAARTLLEESLERYQELGDEVRVMWATRSLAWAHAELGDLDRARPLYEEALRLARAAGSQLFESVALGSLGWLALAQGRVQDSAPLIKESLRIQRGLGDRLEIVSGLGRAAQVLVAVGDAETAARLLGACATLSEELGGGFPWVTRMVQKTLDEARLLDPAAAQVAWEQGRMLTGDRAVDLALATLEGVH